MLSGTWGLVRIPFRSEFLNELVRFVRIFIWELAGLVRIPFNASRKFEIYIGISRFEAEAVRIPSGVVRFSLSSGKCGKIFYLEQGD